MRLIVSSTRIGSWARGTVLPSASHSLTLCWAETTVLWLLRRGGSVE
jgi:hypothetical protein